MAICSTTLAMLNLRCTGSSWASGWMKRAAVPVVLATVTSPPPRSAPAHSRVIDDLPRMPLTSTRCLIRARFRLCRRCSTIPAASITADAVSSTT